MSLRGEKKALDTVIDLQSKQFSRWTQKDIANFFDGVGKYYRKVEAHLSHNLKEEK